MSSIRLNKYEKKATTYLGKDNDTIESIKKQLSYRNYSKYTVTKSIKEMNHLCCYHLCCYHLCCYYQCSPKNITETPIENYLYYLSTVKQFEPDQLNLSIASFTYYYYTIFTTPKKVKQLRSARIPSRVPFVLAPQQVFQFIKSLSKFRDEIIIQLLYSTGIRVGECVNLKRQDINVDRMVIRIVSGKGKKDRYVPLSPMMLEQLEWYYQKYTSDDYIFYGRKKRCRFVVTRDHGRFT